MNKILLSLLALLVASCERPATGTVVNKRHHPPSFHMVQVGDVWMPMPDAAYWTITISGTISDGKTRQSTFRVEESTYSAYNIGDPYPKAER